MFTTISDFQSFTRACFLDLKCNVINKWDLDNSCNCLVAGYDQNRKDLILAAKNGDVKAFSVRLVRSIIHVIYRAQVRIPKENRSLPVQITTQDIPGSFLILTVTGSISCWDTSQLECLWLIDSNRFRCLPTKLFPDKFGSSFAVLCASNDKNALEIWSPPKDFIDCGSHTFIRHDIPIKNRVVSLSLETIGGDFGTALMVVQNNRHAQLWTLTDGIITQHCDLICTGDATSFSGLNNFDMEAELKNDEGVKSSNIDFIKMYSLGQGCFIDGFGCPANEVLYLGLSESDYCLFALHSPTQGDLLWQETINQQTMADRIVAQAGKCEGRAPVLAQFDIPSFDIVSHKNEDVKPGYTNPDMSFNFSGSPSTEQCSAISVAHGKIFAFSPSVSVPTARDSLPNANGLIQLIKPRSLVVLSDNTNSLSFPKLHRLTRAGMLTLNHPQDSIPLKSELEIDQASIAYRSEKLVCISEIKEGFIFDLKQFDTKSTPSKPMRLEVGISPKATCTAILACDVFIQLPPQVLLDEGIKAPIEGDGLMGKHVLAMFGDSDGKIFYSLCNDTSVLQQGFIRAHGAPVLAIVATGDCMKPIWKLGTTKLHKKSPQLQPTVMPGSAIVSMDCEGDVKVWQPLFSNSGALRSKQSQILSIYQLSWYLSGLISTQGPMDMDTISSCCLDPTCTTVYIGYGSGRIQQWVIPGITRSGDNKAQVIREDVWESRKHGTTICSMRMWVNLPDTSVKARSIDFSKLNDPKLSKSAKYAAIITDNTSIATSNEGHIAYTLEELRKFAENSTFVTAAKDNTIVLWRLYVAKATKLPSDITELKSQCLFTECRFLEPIKCQIFTVSATPTEALCYPLRPSGGVSYWRLSVLVKGIVISVAQGEKSTLFLPKAKRKPLMLKDGDKNQTGERRFADTLRDDESLAGTVLEFESGDKVTMSDVAAMPVVCKVLNSQRTVALMSLNGAPCRLSWKHCWQKDSIEIPVQNVFVDTEGDGNEDKKIIPLTTLSPTHIINSPGKVVAYSGMTDVIKSPPKRVDVGTSLVTPEKIAIKKVDKDALKKKLEKESSSKGKKAFKKVASKTIPSGPVVVEHAGIRMRVPANRAENLDEIMPANRAKKYYSPMNEAMGATATKNADQKKGNVLSDNITPSFRPPSPPGGGQSHGALNLSARSSPTQVKSTFNDDLESFNDTTVSNSIVDLDKISGDYIKLIMHDTVQHDPLIKSKFPQQSNGASVTDKKKLSNSMRQPYRSPAVGSVQYPQKSLKRGEYENNRYVAKEGKVQGHDDENAFNKDHTHFRMFVNPVDDSEMISTSTNLHKFCSRQEVEKLSETYSYFKNPSNYYEKTHGPVYYKKDTREKALEAKEWRNFQEEMNTVVSDMDSDGSDGDECAPMDEAKVEKIKDSMLSTELKLFSDMSEAEKEEFLRQKRKENQQLMRVSKDAFMELAGIDKNSQENEENGAPSPTEKAMKAKIATRKVQGWNSVKNAINCGIAVGTINKMLCDSSNKKKVGNNPPVLLNMKEFTTFAKKLNKAVAENEIPPMVDTIVVEATHDRVDLSIQSSKLGKAHIAVYEETLSSTIPSATDFRSVSTLLFRYEGMASVTTENISSTDKIFISIFDLEPSTRYAIAVCGEHEEGNVPCRNTDERIRQSIARFSTEKCPPENMDIEWGRLNYEQKYIEIVAAIYDLDTQVKARSANIEIPSADDAEAWLALVEDEDDLEKLEAEEKDDEGELSPYGLVKLFVDWWTNNDPQFGHSSHRSDFMNREALHFAQDHDLIHQCADEGYISIEDSEIMKIALEEGDVSELPQYLTFRSWLKGGRVMERRYMEKKKKRRLEQFVELRERLNRRESGIDDVFSDGASSDDDENDDTAAKEKDDVENNIDNNDAEGKSHDLGEGSSGAVMLRNSTENEGKGCVAFVDDIVYVEDFDEEDPREVQLKDRTERLEDLSQKVEDSITLVNSLLTAQQHAEEEELSIDDLERRRGLLRYEDVITIMAMIKLKELCEKMHIKIRDLNEGNIQTITGASTFVLVDEADLTPEEPPQATMLSLIGNAKRPLRQWDDMLPEERILEMQLACMLVEISELAVENCVGVPNPEDANILSHTLEIPSRIKRWNNYEKWYVGNETSDNAKKRRPSLARIMFADWEKKCLKKDVAFQETLKKPTASSKIDDAPPSNPKLIKKMARRLSSKRMSSANLDGSSSFNDDDDEIIKHYESVVNKDATVRCRYMKKLLEVVLKSRSLSMMRLLMPPAVPGRVHSQFMFPRLGVITPCYTEPVPRFQPYPSFSTETYSVAEVLLWFNDAELSLDDDRMMVAEEEGKKRQAYLEWLAEEEERMLAGRVMMKREDVFSHHLRHHTHSIEVNPPKIEGNENYKDFVHGPRLPGEYSGLVANERYYEDNTCGINNEDEVYDVLEQMRYEAESALRAKKERKKQLIEERKRKEEEEKRKQELFERDQRIEENKERLDKLRKHLQDLKESRLKEKEMEKQKVRDAALLKEKEEEERIAKLERQQMIKKEQAKVDNEVRLMTMEDEIHHIQRNHLREFANMEHEDICGQLMREKYNNEERTRRQRIEELESVYEKYEPFVFKKSQIRVPYLHTGDEILDADSDVLPDKVDWKLLQHGAEAKKSKTNLNENTGSDESSFYTLDDIFQGNEKNDELLEKLLFTNNSKILLPDSVFENDDDGVAPPDIDSLNFWPRTMNETAIETPMVWKGPSGKNAKPRQLRKKQRPYTVFNSSEVYLQKIWKVSDAPKVVFLETSTDNTLEALGFEPDIIRSFGQREEVVHLPPLKFKQNADDSTRTLKKPVSPGLSFIDPVVYRPTSQGLSIDSTSNDCDAFEYVKSSSRGFPTVGGVIDNAPNTYRVKTAKGMARKDGNKTISSEKKSLKEMIRRNSLSAMDPFYVEACKPELRKSDSLSDMKGLPEFQLPNADDFIQKMDSAATDNSNACNSPGTSSVNSTCEDKYGYRDTVAISDEIFHSARSENTEIINELKSSMESNGPHGSSMTDFRVDSADKSIFPKPSLDDPEFRITDRGVVYEPNNSNQSTTVYRQYEEYHPPFYRKPFGVKGRIKPLEEESFIVRAKKSADAIASQKEKEERIEQRKLAKLSKEAQIQLQSKKKKKHGPTAKSLHRDEFAALMRKSFEETSRQYDCSNVNFINNKGL